MAAAEILAEIAEKQGWSDETALSLALEYIDNQGSDDAFEDFLRTHADEENTECVDEGDAP